MLPVEVGEYDETVDTVIRQSTIGQARLCEYRVKLKDEEGFLEPVNEKMVFGTCLHYLIAEDLTGNDALTLLSSMNEWVEIILSEEYDWSLDKVDDVPSFFSELSSAYRMWKTEVYPKLGEPIAVEKKMLLPLGEGEKGMLWLQGTPDAVFEDHIVDWKTSGKAWKQNKADYALQPSLYPALVRQNLGIEVKKFVFYVYDRSQRRWDVLRTARRVKDINASLLTAYDYARKIEAGNLTANPVPDSFNLKRGWYCSANYCPAWNICPAKYLADDVNENEIAIRSWQ